MVIEAFLFVVERILLEQFLETVSGQRVYAKQPGSFNGRRADAETLWSGR